jgi:hypothetical protein
VTQEPSRSGQDPIGDFQRWLFRSGARSVSREVGDQIRSALGVGGGPADVWAKATVPPADEAPECAWCPFCRAARVLRESGPGVSSQMAAAGEAMGGLARDAMSVFESALAATGRAARAGAGQGQGASGSVWADVTAADPGAADSAAADPSVADPAVADPAVADSAVADSAVADPAVADSAVADSAVADSAVADSAVADPGVADPAVADSAAAGREPAPGPAEEPESAGPAGGPPHEPDDRG